MTLRAGMTIVVQPNVITTDQRAGVQVGEMLLITDHGLERLHKAPRALIRVS
jgi:Xaa-Pro aminopeptidase